MRSSGPSRSVTVHPRSRGEIIPTVVGRFGLWGSPPLARGNHYLGDPNRYPERFTPARAGKSDAVSRRRHAERVHPRSRGEIVFLRPFDNPSIGSPPLARGNPLMGGLRPSISGFTPARAGKSRNGLKREKVSRVHPRSRGEISHLGSSLGLSDGSPPLARGNRVGQDIQDHKGRFTPARAGKSCCRGV